MVGTKTSAGDQWPQWRWRAKDIERVVFLHRKGRPDAADPLYSYRCNLFQSFVPVCCGLLLQLRSGSRDGNSQHRLDYRFIAPWVHELFPPKLGLSSFALTIRACGFSVSLLYNTRPYWIYPFRCTVACKPFFRTVPNLKALFSLLIERKQAADSCAVCFQIERRIVAGNCNGCCCRYCCCKRAAGGANALGYH